MSDEHIYDDAEEARLLMNISICPEYKIIPLEYLKNVNFLISGNNKNINIDTLAYNRMLRLDQLPYDEYDHTYVLSHIEKINILKLKDMEPLSYPEKILFKLGEFMKRSLLWLFLVIVWQILSIFIIIRSSVTDGQKWSNKEANRWVQLTAIFGAICSPITLVVFGRYCFDNRARIRRLNPFQRIWRPRRILRLRYFRRIWRPLHFERIWRPLHFQRIWSLLSFRRVWSLLHFRRDDNNHRNNTVADNIRLEEGILYHTDGA
ncbi:hypothetical protein B5S30_g1810 [[Candida] boidinii]|nr:hypothetical protein B5S30_g1810 [[Candida] boidinii]